MLHMTSDLDGNLKGKDHSEDLGVDGRTFEWFIEK